MRRFVYTVIGKLAIYLASSISSILVALYYIYKNGLFGFVIYNVALRCVLMISEMTEFFCD